MRRNRNQDRAPQGVALASRIFDGAIRLAGRLVPRQQSASAIPALVELYRALSLLRGDLDRSGFGLDLRSKMRDSGRGRRVSFASRMDSRPCGDSVLAEAHLNRAQNVSVTKWHSSHRISQFDRTPFREELIWCGSQDPRPLPLPRFSYTSCFPHRFRRRWFVQDLRPHSQYPPARSQNASSTVALGNSKVAAIPVFYHATALKQNQR